MLAAPASRDAARTTAAASRNASQILRGGARRLATARDAFAFFEESASVKETCTFALSREPGGLENKSVALLTDDELETVARELRESPGTGIWLSEVAGALAHPAFDVDCVDPRPASARSAFPLENATRTGPSQWFVRAAASAVDDVARMLGGGAVAHAASVAGRDDLQIVAAVTRKVREVGPGEFEAFPGKWHIYFPGFYGPLRMTRLVYERMLAQRFRDGEASFRAGGAEADAFKTMVDAAGLQQHRLCVAGSVKDDADFAHHVPAELWVRAGRRMQRISLERVQTAEIGRSRFMLGYGFAEARDDPYGVLQRVGPVAPSYADGSDSREIACDFLPLDGDGDSGSESREARCRRCPYHAAPRGSVPLFEFARPSEGGWSPRVFERALWSLFQLRPRGRADAHAVRISDRTRAPEFLAMLGLQPRSPPQAQLLQAAQQPQVETSQEVAAAALLRYFLRHCKTRWCGSGSATWRCNFERGQYTWTVKFAQPCFSDCLLHAGATDHEFAARIVLTTSRMGYAVVFSCRVSKEAGESTRFGGANDKARGLHGHEPQHAGNANLLVAYAEFRTAAKVFDEEWTRREFSAHAKLVALRSMNFPHPPCDWGTVFSRTPDVFDKCPSAMLDAARSAAANRGILPEPADSDDAAAAQPRKKRALSADDAAAHQD